MRVDSRLPTGTAVEPNFGAGNYTRVGIYGDRIIDRHLHSCSVCGRHAFGYSVRIRQDAPSAPVCVDCRLNVTKATQTSYPHRDRVRRLFSVGTRRAA